MIHKRWLITILVLGVFVVYSASYVLAQEPSPPVPDPEVTSPDAVNAYISPAMSYQGRLVENGVPVNGNRSMTLRLCLVESGGAPIWEEGPKDVSVQNGLFQVVLGDSTPLPMYLLDREQWLEVEIEGTILPRQRLYGAPYALSLAPGAHINGDLSASTVLYVNNESDGFGLYGRSETGIGVYGESDGSVAGVTGFSWDGPGVEGIGTNGAALHANGNGRITSKANSYIFIPAIEGELFALTDADDVDVRNWGQGNLELASTVDGIKQIIFPISLPGVLYGQSVIVEEILLGFNSSQNAHTPKITRVQIYKSSVYEGDYDDIVDDTHGGLGWTSPNNWLELNFALTDDNQLTAVEGFLTVRVHCDIPAGENIFFNGVRVKLSHEN